MSDLRLNIETPRQASDREDDGFFTTLASLRQVLTPTNTQQQPVLQLLQQEKRDLIKEMNKLREGTQQQLKFAQEAARKETLQHAEEINEFQQRLLQQEERANARCKELEMELAHRVTLLAEVRQQKEQAVQQVEDENQRLTESMIQLENENKTLHERCEHVEMAHHKLQTEVRESLGVPYLQRVKQHTQLTNASYSRSTRERQPRSNPTLPCRN
jgi:DNA repair exonuclease SbcCD ATPase subunit